MSTWKKMRLVLAALFLSIGLAGCFDIVGGGWIWSAHGPEAGKGTFAFDLVCDPDTDVAGGHITYHDHGVTTDDFSLDVKGKAKHVAIQGEVLTGADFFDGGCSDGTAYYAVYLGEYTPIPASLGDGGYFEVSAYDGGETGPDKDDGFQILIKSGVYAGYFNAGELRGGNLSVPD